RRRGADRQRCGACSSQAARPGRYQGPAGGVVARGTRARGERRMKRPARVTSTQFFGRLRWLDGKPLLDTVEPYRRELFTKSLDSYGPDNRPIYNMVLAGRGKKNAKSLDMILASLFCLLIRRSPQGSDGLLLANDADQAADDLLLAKRLIACNPDLARE